MTDRLLPYIAGAMGVLFLSAGCEQANIYSEVDFNVRLDPSNTYVAGEPVRFNISGNPDNLLFYSGEIGHAYQYRDRYEVPVEQVTSIVLDMNIEHRYGEKDHSALEIYYTNEFPGLNGNDAQADVALVKGMYEGGMSGWTKVDFEDPGPKADVTFQVQTGNMKDCVDNLCIAFHWNPSENTVNNDHKIPMDTYRINGIMTIECEGMNPQQRDLKSLMGQAIIFDHDPVYWMDQGNGSIRIQDGTWDVIFQGGYYDEIKHDCNGWLFSVPQAFNVSEPDQGLVIKNIQNYLDTYEYTFTEPGTYTVTFVGTNSNYIDESRDVQEFEINIVPPAVTAAE